MQATNEWKNNLNIKKQLAIFEITQQCVRKMRREIKCNRKKERRTLVSTSSSVTTKYFTAALLSFPLAETFGEILDRGKKKRKKRQRGKRVVFFSPGVSGIRAGDAGDAKFLRGTPSFAPSSRVLPPLPPRIPPNVVGMDEGSKTKDERKKKSVRKARGDRSITNHYGPSGTAKRTSRRRFRRVFLFRPLPDFTRELSVTALIT